VFERLGPPYVKGFLQENEYSLDSGFWWREKGIAAKKLMWLSLYKWLA
jgi:hypothetical protein